MEMTVEQSRHKGSRAGSAEFPLHQPAAELVTCHVCAPVLTHQLSNLAMKATGLGVRGRCCHSQQAKLVKLFH